KEYFKAGAARTWHQRGFPLFPAGTFFRLAAMRARLWRMGLAAAALAAMLAVVRGRPVVSSRAPERTVRLVAVGDILLGDAAQKQLDRHGYQYPFRRLRPLLQNADVLVGNLEGTITEQRTPFDPDKKWSYKSRPAAAAALKKAGFTLL